MNRAAEAASKLVKSSDGRRALEELMGHDSPSVRCAAAARVLARSPEAAVPVLEDLLLWAWKNRTGDLFGETIQVSGNVEGLLSVHLGINILEIGNYVRAKHGLPPKRRREWAP